MPEENKTLRMDFKHELVSFDEKTGKIKGKLTFDPERYELKTIDGKKGYLDKFDNIFIPLEVLKKSLEKFNNMPIFYNPPKIENADEYISGRIEKIREYIKGNSLSSYEFHDKSEDFLNGLQKDKQRFVILSIDLKGSTKMSQQLSPEDNSKIVSLYLQEMTYIIDMFRGYVLKYVGDGLIAYFPEPDYLGMNNNALDCALTLKKMIIYAINPVLKDGNLPELNFRIGLDSGEAMIKTLGVENIKMHKDLIGETVNLAAKIQGLANDKQILMGKCTALCLHTFWRTKIKKMDCPATWDYKDKNTQEPYSLYCLLEDW